MDSKEFSGSGRFGRKRRGEAGLLIVGLIIVFPSQVFGSQLSLPKALSAEMVLARDTRLPMIPLRGFGRISGQYLEYGLRVGEGRVGVLSISCEDPAKAELLLVKYDSDLHNIESIICRKLPSSSDFVPPAGDSVESQSLAVRIGSDVLILSADSRDLLGKAIRDLKIGAGESDSAVKTGVPEFLNKFDRWGFGFWLSNPLAVFGAGPNKGKLAFVDELEWAKSAGVALQFNVALNLSDTADGLLDDNGTRWSIEAARNLGIPVFIQTMQATPTWLANRYPDQMQQKAPEYVGGTYSEPNGDNGFYGGSESRVSWASVQASDEVFADAYQAVAKYRSFPNVTGYGEWHGEVVEGPMALMADYGPVADRRYRDYLRAQYRTPSVVDDRWYGGRGRIKSWSDVRMPEVASFLGWGDRSVDLKGQWRTCAKDLLAPEDRVRWGAVGLNDGGWPRLVAPGDDRQIFKEKPRTETVFRRSFELTSGQYSRLMASGKAFLYVWTLEGAVGRHIFAAVNGRAVGDWRINSPMAWAAFDAGAALRPGGNLVALDLPWGELSYRIYLSPDAPRCYPNLGAGEDARWVDYRDFISWMREDGLRRSIEAIRRQDPDRPIKLYAPGAIPDVMKELAEDYGCYFHDTGLMSGEWNDDLPALSRSSGLPMSVEPGNPARDLTQLKEFFGRWLTEGIQAVDYFSDISDIYSRPDEKAWFEAHLPLVHLIGKFHSPDASVAVLMGSRSRRLTGFPWDQLNSPLLWASRRGGLGTLAQLPVPRDAVTEADFRNGLASRYRVIVDDGTLIMDEDLITRIERWVSNGGIFITQGETGRHSPEAPDSWPISRLTGYRVVGIGIQGRVSAIPGQSVFRNRVWNERDSSGSPEVRAEGVRLAPVDSACRNIVGWAQGGIAMGYRSVGRGKVVTLGALMPEVPDGWDDLLAWCGLPVVAPPAAPGCRVAHFLSNNGLYDIYVLWAERVTSQTTVALTVAGGQWTLIDVMTGKRLTGRPAGNGVVFSGIQVEPLETYALVAPRGSAVGTPLEWLRLQRDWWSGTKAPESGRRLQPSNDVWPLDDLWRFHSAAADGEHLGKLVGRDTDDGSWTTMPIGVRYDTRFPGVQVGIYRRWFTLPDSWRDGGRVQLWIRGSTPFTWVSPWQVQVFLDGMPIWDSRGQQYASCVADVTDRLSAGRHLLAIAAQSDSPIGGVNGNVWLNHIPPPSFRQSLAGDWGGGVRLPGKAVFGSGMAAREFVPGGSGIGGRSSLFLDVSQNNISRIILNGHLLSRDPGGGLFFLDVSPYLSRDSPNNLTLLADFPQQPVTVKAVELRVYAHGAN